MEREKGKGGVGDAGFSAAGYLLRFLGEIQQQVIGGIGKMDWWINAELISASQLVPLLL